MALIKTVAEFKEYVRIAGTISLETLMASIPDAQEKYIRPILGDDLLDALDEYYNDDDATDDEAFEALIPCVQRPLARFTLLIASPEIDVTVTDSGIAVIMNQNLAPASSDRVKKYDHSNEKRAWDNIETLIRFLEANESDYDTWVDSSAYTLAKRNLVNSALEFDAILNIDKSSLYFSRIRSLLDDADLLFIKPSISAELFATILEEVQAGDISAEIEAILPYLQRAEVFYAAGEGIDSSKYENAGLSQIFLERDMAMYSRKAEQYLGEARKIIDLNPDDYPDYRDSDVYVGLNDDSETDYTVFDNTDEDNHIFVM